MTPERHRQAKALFLQLCDLPAGERGSALSAAVGNDEELRAVVLGMLGHDEADDALSERAIQAGRAVIEQAMEGTRFGEFVSPPVSAPQQVGRYRLLRLIGEGGMGSVYEAEQESPRRTVALKLIRSGLASADILKRFQRESDVLARLQHPGIAHIYEAGIGDVVALDGSVSRQPFFAMELVRGRPLLDFACEHALPERERLVLLALVADAVHHAHQKGVIHRDLKPANILVQEEGTEARRHDATKGDALPTESDSSLRAFVPSSLRAFPKILDFGVARLADSDQPLTMHTNLGQIVGTLPYMSPEQVAGDSRQIDTRSDVYSLGVILCEILTGALPYELTGKPLVEAARIIREAEPARLGALIRRRDRGLRIDRDLETITAKALQKEKERRYASAAEFAADLRRYLRNEPVTARPATTFYQIRKFAARNRVLVGGGVATLLALVIGLVGIAIFATREAQQRRVAEQNALAAQRAQAQAEQVAYRAALGAAQAELQRGNAVAAEERLDDASPALRGWEWRHMRWRAAPFERSFGEPGSVLDCALTRDETRLIVVGAGARARIYDFATGSEQGRLELFTAPPPPAFRPDDLQFASLSISSHPTLFVCTRFLQSRTTSDLSSVDVCAWQLDPPQRLWERQGLASAQPATLSDDATEIEVADQGDFLILDARTGETRRRIELSPRARLSPQLVGEHRTAVAYDSGSGLTVERVSDGQILWRSDAILWLAMDARRLIASIESPGLVFRDALSGQVLRKAAVRPEERAITGLLGVSDDLRSCLIAGGAGLSYRRMDTAFALPGFDLHQAAGSVTRISPSGRHVVAAGAKHPVRVYSNRMTTPPFRADAPRHGAAGAISPDRRWTISANWGYVTLWDAVTGEELWTRYDGLPWSTAPAFSPDGGQLIYHNWSAFAQAELVLLDITSTAPVASFHWPRGDVNTILWPAGSTAVIVTTAAGEVLRVEPAGGTIEREVSLGTAVTGAAVSRDGHLLALASADAGDVVLHDTESLAPFATLPRPNRTAGRTPDPDHDETRIESVETATTLEFSADRRQLAAGTETGRLLVWRLADRSPDRSSQPRRMVRRGDAPALAVGAGCAELIGDAALSDQPLDRLGWIDAENRIVAADRNGRLVVYDVEREAVLVTLTPDLGRIFDLDFDSEHDRLTVAASAAPLALLETSPAGDELEARSANAAARVCVDAAYRELAFAEDVSKRIAESPDLAADVRDAALRLVARRGEHPRWLNSEALTASRADNLTPEAYAVALRKSERAYAILPMRHDMLITQATLLYRLGRNGEALERMQEARQKAAQPTAFVPAGVADSPQAWATLALIHQRGGRDAEAHAALEKAVDTLRSLGSKADHWDRRFVAEARAALRPADRLTQP